MQQHSGQTPSVARSHGASTSSLSRPLMSHGSQQVSARMEAWPMRLIGVCGTRTELRNTLSVARFTRYGVGLIFHMCGYNRRGFCIHGWKGSRCIFDFLVDKM